MTTDSRSAADEPGNGRDLIRPILQRKWWILAAVVIATVGTYLYSSRKEKQYSATASLFLQTTASSNPLATQSTMPPTDRNAENQARLVTSRSVIEAAASR